MVVAAILRLMFIRAGLPGLAMLFPDEGTVVPKSIQLLGSPTLNPRWFLYPSGFFMVLAGLVTIMRPFASGTPGFAWGTYSDLLANPDPYMLAGRAISVVCGLVLVVATFLIARRVCGARFGLLAAALMAVSPMAVEYSHYATTDMLMTATLALGTWRLLVATDTGRLRDILVAAALLGLAVTFKYNAGLFLVPMFVWIAVRTGPTIGRRLATLALAGATALAGFLVGTPHALLNFQNFKLDLKTQNAIQSDGWLGYENVRPGYIYNITPNLTGAIGVVALVLAAIGIVVGLRRHSTVDLILWPYVLGSYLYVSRWNANADRYLFPILPMIVVAVALGAFAVWRALPARRRSVVLATVLTALTLAQPLVGVVRKLDRFSKPEERILALPQIASMIPPGTKLAYEPLTPPVMFRRTAIRLQRRDGIARPFFFGVRVYPPQPGRPPSASQSVCRLQRIDVTWVMTSDSLERRVRNAGARYPRSVKYYDDLARYGELALRIPPGLGPGAKLWKLPGDIDCPPPATRQRNPSAATPTTATVGNP